MTVVVDLAPGKHDRPARLLDMVEGRGEKAFASWLVERPQSFRDHVKAIAMDAFAGHKKAARHEVPHAVEVLDPFHIVSRRQPAAVRCGLQRERTGRRGVCQKIIRRYAQEDKRKGRGMMAELVEAPDAKGAAPGCPELAALGRTLKRRMGDVLAFFDWEHSANGLTEAVNGRLETLHGIALGFRNLDNYVTRSLLHTGGLRHTIQAHL